MRAITLTQPWASLVAGGKKLIETRSWTTAYRGDIAIHAAKSFPSAARTFADVQFKLGRLPWPLPLGSVVAIAELVDVVSTDTFVADWTTGREGRREVDCWTATPLEQDLGDFGPGRYAWFLRSIRPLRRPVITRGALGLWEWNDGAPRPLEDPDDRHGEVPGA